jgi:hypothetical protein
MSHNNQRYNDAGIKIAHEAKRWLHIVEHGKNAGFNDPVFEHTLRKLGWRPGQAWCAYFCKMIWLNVYDETDMQDEIQDVLSASVLATWRNAKSSPVIKTSEKPVVGGIVCWGTGNGKGHEGIHVEIRDDFNTVTVEGNTTRAGVREGDKVMEKRRKLQPTAKHNGDWRYLGTIIPPDYGYNTPKSAV